MKEKGFALILFILVILVITLLVILGLMFMKQGGIYNTGYKTRSPSSRITSTPKSYDECVYQLSSKHTDTVAINNVINYVCVLEVGINDNILYTQCLDAGGNHIPPYAIKCPGCGYTEEKCILRYYNPTFTFPSNYDGCLKASYISGSGDGGDICSFSIFLTGVYNKDIAQNLFNECKNMDQQTTIRSHLVENSNDSGKFCVVDYYERAIPSSTLTPNK